MSGDLVVRIPLSRTAGIGPFTYRHRGEVMAVPGSPHDARAHGCNQLIRDGATFVRNADEVLEAIALLSARLRSPADLFDHEPEGAESPEDEDAPALSILSLLGPSPVPVDDVFRLSGAASGGVQMALLELDLASRLDRHAGNRVSLRVA